MKFFLDTANLDEIKEANEMGLIDGVTTNPSLIAKEGQQLVKHPLTDKGLESFLADWKKGGFK